MSKISQNKNEKGGDIVRNPLIQTRVENTFKSNFSNTLKLTQVLVTKILLK